MYRVLISELHPLCTVCTTIAPRVLHFSAVHSVFNRDSGSTRAIQVLKVHKWVQNHVFSDLNWLDF